MRHRARQAAEATPHQTIYSDHNAFSFQYFELKSFKHRAQDQNGFAAAGQREETTGSVYFPVLWPLIVREELSNMCFLQRRAPAPVLQLQECASEHGTEDR